MVQRLKKSIGAFLIILIIGIWGFMIFEELSFLDALYVTVVTLATVGYGDITPVTPEGRIFVIFFIVAGFSVTYYTLIMVVSLLLEGQIRDLLGRRGMERSISKMQDHIIVCGAGKVGSNVVQSLLEKKEPFVVIEKDDIVYQALREEKILVLHGDATLDSVLLQAGVAEAKGVIAALSDDADNVYVTLTARSLNPTAHIVARAERLEAENKLRIAGANQVIVPSVMGARQMVASMTRPVFVDFVENVLHNEELPMDFSEVTINETSSFVGKRFAESQIKERFHSIVIALRRGEELMSNPHAQERIQVGDVLLVLGPTEYLGELQHFAQSSEK